MGLRICAFQVHPFGIRKHFGIDICSTEAGFDDCAFRNSNAANFQIGGCTTKHRCHRRLNSQNLFYKGVKVTIIVADLVDELGLLDESLHPICKRVCSSFSASKKQKPKNTNELSHV